MLIILLDCCGVGFPVVQLLVVELLLTKLKANGAFLMLFKSPKTQQQCLFLLIKMNFSWALFRQELLFLNQTTPVNHITTKEEVCIYLWRCDRVQTLVLFLSAGWRHLLVGQCKKEKENSSHIILLTKFGFFFTYSCGSVISQKRKTSLQLISPKPGCSHQSIFHR